MNLWLQGNGIEVYAKDNGEKSVVTERFIK